MSFIFGDYKKLLRPRSVTFTELAVNPTRRATSNHRCLRIGGSSKWWPQNPTPTLVDARNAPIPTTASLRVTTEAQECSAQTACQRDDWQKRTYAFLALQVIASMQPVLPARNNWPIIWTT